MRLYPIVRAFYFSAHQFAHTYYNIVAGKCAVLYGHGFRRTKVGSFFYTAKYTTAFFFFSERPTGQFNGDQRCFRFHFQSFLPAIPSFCCCIHFVSSRWENCLSTLRKVSHRDENAVSTWWDWFLPCLLDKSAAACWNRRHQERVVAAGDNKNCKKFCLSHYLV